MELIMNKSIFESIFTHVLSLDVIDTHEHLPGYENARNKNTDVLKEYLDGYFNRDLVSAGLSKEGLRKVTNTEIPLMERWLLVEPYWEAAGRTGYGRNLDISVKLLYGIEKINRSTIEALNDSFMKSLEPGHFRKVLKEKSKIRVSILDSNLDCDKEFFRSVFRLDEFIIPIDWAEVENIENVTGVRISSFDDWLEACEIIFNKAFNCGAVALKTGLAYLRTLKYDRATKNDAEEGFNDIFKNIHYPDWIKRGIIVSEKFQNYMMHFVLRLANRNNCTVQVHTGLHEGNGNIICNSDPSLLSNLFIEYPFVDFDIFHIGYPYQNVLSALAKNFPNVYIDMCWANIISPAACVQSLVEWIDSVPLNKISAFGGDNQFIDGICGHQYIARMNASKALAIKVEDGVIDVDEAKHIAKMLLYDNPMKILKLEGKI